MARTNSKGVAVMIAELLAGPCTASELALITGHWKGSIQTYLNEMHELGAVRICAYERCKAGVPRIRVYELNAESKPDVSRPKRQTGKDRAKNMRERKKLARLGGSGWIPLAA